MTGLIAFLILIGVLITVHEFGHYIVAKAFGVKVEAFSIGFGSPIIQFQWGETQYKICWIPLGGYVRMMGQIEEEQGEKPPTRPEDVGRAIGDQSPFARILIYAAGPAMNLILPFFILMPFIALSTSYESVPDNTIGAVDSSMPAGLSGLKPGDKIVAINDEPVDAFWQIRAQIGEYNEADGPLKLSVRRAHSEHLDLVAVSPKPIRVTHPFLGYEITRYQIGYQPAFLDASIGLLNQDNVWYRAGLRSGDRVKKINGTPVENMVELEAALQAHRTGTLMIVEALRKGSPIDTRFPFLREQKTITLQFEVPDELSLDALGIVHASVCVDYVDPEGPAKDILKEGDCIVGIDSQRHSLGGYIERALKSHPKDAKTISFVREGVERTGMLQPEAYTLKDPMAGAVPLWSKGFTMPQQTFLPPKMTQSKDRWGHGWYEAKTRIPKEIEDTIRTIGGMLSGGVSPTQLSGPLTMYHLADSSVRAGFESYLNLMVLLSLSIGLFNLLPIPLLDGGQILIASIEWVTRRPIPPQLQVGLQYVGIVMILALLIFALGNDAVRTWRLTNG